MDSLREFGKDLAKYIPSFVVPVLVSLVYIPLFTKYLAPDEWGNYVLVLSSVELLIRIGVAWLNAATVRFYAQSMEEGEPTRFISTVVASGLLASLMIAGLVGIAVHIWDAPLRESNLFDLVYTGLWFFLGRSLFTILASLLRAQRKASHYSALIAWQHCSRLAFGVLFVIVLNRGSQGLLAGWTLGLTIAVIAFGAETLFRQFNIRQFSGNLAKSMFLYGIPIVGGDIAFWLLRLSDRYVLRIFRSASEVGIYAVGVDLADRSLAMLISLLAASSWPLVVQTWETKGRQPTSDFLTQLMRIYLIVCVPATVGMALLSPSIIRLLADDAYYEGHRVMVLIAASVFLYGFQRWFQLVLALYEKTFLIFISVMSGAVTNILLNLILVPSLGYQIAAVNNLLGYLVFTLMVIWLSRKSMTWQFPHKSLVRVLLASLPMAGGIVAFQSLSKPDWLTLMVCVSGGASLYALALLILKEITFSDLNTLGRSLAHKVGLV